MIERNIDARRMGKEEEWKMLSLEKLIFERDILALFGKNAH